MVILGVAVVSTPGNPQRVSNEGLPKAEQEWAQPTAQIQGLGQDSVS